jgi:hypothetical protein
VPIRFSFTALFAAAALFIATAGPLATKASAQTSRTWVSGVGDDTNPCSRTAPCKTLAGTISKTGEGGEINAIDSGGFGSVTITKAITIDLTSVLGGVLNAGTNGIIVNAGPTDDVVLRGLDIDGFASAAACGYAGLSGIRVLSARSVTIADSQISEQQKAIDIAPTSPVKVLVNRVDLTNNCTNGIVSVPTGAGSADMTIRDSTISNSGTALSVSSNARAWLSGSTIFGNALGLQALGTGAINDFGDNQLMANTADGSATADVAPNHIAPAPGAAGPAGPPGPAGKQGDPGVKLLVAVSDSTLSAKAGARVALSFLTTAAGSGTLRILNGSKTVATVHGKARSGANTIRWNGRIGKKAATAGTYRLSLRVVGSDGQTDTTTAKLTLKRH